MLAIFPFVSAMLFGAGIDQRVFAHPRDLSGSPKKEGNKPMADKNNGLQDLFLNSLRKTKTPVTMFLVKGVKLQGIITWFDNFSVLLRRDGQAQLVYKHAISDGHAVRCRRYGRDPRHDGCGYSQKPDVTGCVPSCGCAIRRSP